MATSMTFDEHGDAIGDAWMVIRDHANRVGPGAAVRTCPDWTVRDLVAHQGMVHRWATGILRGTDVDTAAVEAAGIAAVDQLAWFDDGAKDLLQALVDAPDDLDVFFFLHDAPAPKLAWARRQCHETTIHAVDAMSASYGGPPPAADTWIRPALAVDGIDELLTGFLPRPRWQLRTAKPTTVSVEATDTGDAWTVALGPDDASTTPGRAEEPDVVLTGSAVQLYLGLWNRGDELESSDPDFLATWRERARVTW
jgi:uncharacterized protein (TIGR03083 family)